MLTHAEIWQAIDRLAAHYSFSPSGLARRAGLDPTTFNKSKRIARDGRPRWPSTESISRVLEATGASLPEFITLMDQGGPRSAVLTRLPVLGISTASNSGQFDEQGHPAGPDWDEFAFAAIDDPHGYALQVSGTGYSPVYRDGDLLVVSPKAECRYGDRVVVRAADGRLSVHQFARQGGRQVELLALASGEPAQSLPAETVAFVHRIVWATQ